MSIMHVTNMLQTVPNLLYNQAASVISKPAATYVAITIVFLSGFALKWLFKRKANDHHRHKLPPSPFKLPIIGNLHQLGVLPHRALALLSKRHGPLMLLRLGSKPTLVVSSPSAAQEILKTHDACFLNRPEMRVTEKFCYGGVDVGFTPYADKSWRYMKGLLVQQILSPTKVKTFRSVREEETLLMVQKIEGSLGDPFDLSELLFLLTVGLICKVAFGRKYSEEGGDMKVKKLVSEFLMLGGAFDVADFIPWLGWLNNFTGRNTRVDEVFQEFDSLLESVLQDHIDDPCSVELVSEEQMDFVDVLIDIHKKSSDAAIPLSRDNIKALILDLFVAGTEALFAAMEWAMTELIRHPEIMKKAQDEIRGIMRSRKCVTEDDIAKMDYLKAVIKETLRFYPSVPLLVPRESTQHVNIQGYDIPTKTRVMVNAWAIGRDPHSWDNPEVFDPERFLRGGRASARDFHGLCFEFIPFSAGRRGCPGISYSGPVMELALASLLHRFDWALPGGMKVEHLDVSESYGFSLSRRQPLNVVATAAASTW